MEKTAEQLRREHIALEGDTHGKNKWAILFTVLIMTFMVCLDSTVVTVALPVMQKELGVGLDRIQLVSSVYLLATCVAMLPFGRLGDVRGKVNVFQLGVIVFSVGSLLCGLSSSLEVLILARIVQGIGYLVDGVRAFAGPLGRFPCLVNGFRSLVGSGSVGGRPDVDV